MRYYIKSCYDGLIGSTSDIVIEYFNVTGLQILEIQRMQYYIRVVTINWSGLHIDSLDIIGPIQIGDQGFWEVAHNNTPIWFLWSSFVIVVLSIVSFSWEYAVFSHICFLAWLSCGFSLLLFIMATHWFSMASNSFLMASSGFICLSNGLLMAFDGFWWLSSASDGFPPWDCSLGPPLLFYLYIY